MPRLRKLTYSNGKYSGMLTPIQALTLQEEGFILAGRPGYWCLLNAKRRGDSKRRKVHFYKPHWIDHAPAVRV
jgi:hypothetical protein